MKRLEFVTSNYFDEMIEELGIDAISDLDITEEISRQDADKDLFLNEGEFTRIETWEILDNGNLEVFIEIL